MRGYSRLAEPYHTLLDPPSDDSVSQAEQPRRMGVLSESEERELAAWVRRSAQPTTFGEDRENDEDQRSTAGSRVWSPDRCG